MRLSLGLNSDGIGAMGNSRFGILLIETMETTDLFKVAGLSSSGMAIVLIIYRILKYIKGKKVVSSCCGKRIEMGIDVTEMTPKELVIHNPIIKEKPESKETSS